MRRANPGVPRAPASLSIGAQADPMMCRIRQEGPTPSLEPDGESAPNRPLRTKLGQPAPAIASRA